MDEKAFVPFDYLWRAYGGVGRLARDWKLSRRAAWVWKFNGSRPGSRLIICSDSGWTKNIITGQNSHFFFTFLLCYNFIQHDVEPIVKYFQNISENISNNIPNNISNNSSNSVSNHQFCRSHSAALSGCFSKSI